MKSDRAIEAAAWGTMAHHWKETGEVVAVPGFEKLAPLFQRKLKVGGVRREEWWPEDMRHELALAVAPFEAYHLLEDGAKAEKEAWKAAHDDRYCTGTVDGDAYLFDVLWIDDLKTGRMVTLEDHVEQVKFYALGVARVLDYRGPVHVTITHWPRYRTDNRPERLGRVVEQDELSAFEDRLARLRNDILRDREHAERGDVTKIDLYPGEEQCLWCPSKRICPDVGRIGN